MCIFNIGAIIIIHVRQLTNAYNIVLNKILYDRNVVWRLHSNKYNTGSIDYIIDSCIRW